MTTKIFDTLYDMKVDTTLAEGDLCETLGYSTRGDGGGAKYIIDVADTSSANEMDIVSLGNATVVAKYMNEGKPVNVLQFGAKNKYKYYEVDDDVCADRNDSMAIQRAIDYTDELLCSSVDSTVERGINYIIVPGGHYMICDQIVMPPYMQMHLDGDVQFLSFVTAGEQKLYKYSELCIPSSEGYDTVSSWDDQYCNYYLFEKEGQSVKTKIRKQDEKVLEIVTTSVENTGSGDNTVTIETQVAEMEEIISSEGNNAYADISKSICTQRDVFALNDYKISDDNISLISEHQLGEYYVFKKGIIKICYRYDNNGMMRIPYSGKYIVAPTLFSEIFCGDGSLTIMNKMTSEDQDKNVTVSPYICGLEIGDFYEYLRYFSKNSPTHLVKSHYENLRFSNLKIANCYVGILCRANNFYSSVIANTEFFHNKIAFQWGVNGETEVIKSVKTYENVTDIDCLPNEYTSKATSGIMGETCIDCIEENHFRDCLFTGNNISVNILLSGFGATFTSCHFDFDNCVFRAAYRTSIIVDKCHIEGIGKELRKKYFATDDEVRAGNVTIDNINTAAFNNRAQKYPLDEYVGIIYAKPITKFGGTQVEQWSYVDISITSSVIVDNENIPWSLFSYYNKGAAVKGDGHHRSRLYLNNNSYSSSNSFPLSYLATERDGVVQSSFVLSEVPEIQTTSQSGTDEVFDEKTAIQNIPVISRDSVSGRGYGDPSKARGNHRFLSNRTLENKYPYFQNVEIIDGVTEGITITNVDANDYPVKCSEGITSNPFAKFDRNAKSIRIDDIINIVDDPLNENMVSHIVTITLDNDEIECEKDDVITAALVTDMVTYNSRFYTHNNERKEEQSSYSHHIKFMEYNAEGVKLGTYDYEVPYSVGQTVDKSYFFGTYPSSSACRHVVKNKDAVKIRIEIDYYRSVILTDSEMNSSCSYLSAILVEKNK